MGLTINIPTCIKIREGVRVTLNQVVTHAVEPDKPIHTLKDSVKRELEEGKRDKHNINADDYEVSGTASSVSFWFSGVVLLNGHPTNTSVKYVVGEEITQEDFDRISADLLQLEFKGKHDGKPSNNETSKEA